MKTASAAAAAKSRVARRTMRNARSAIASLARRTKAGATGKKGSSAAGGASLADAAGHRPEELDAKDFARRLMPWYRAHARELPWRGIDDPYATWLSEIMLQQTRVGTVIERYGEFLRRFPTLRALAEAQEDDVLAVWSGLGYYRRARMLHRTAQFVVREIEGKLPGTAAELRTLPGIGPYTAAAVASIAFGESIAVVDGNVERVLLRIMGQPEENTAAGRARVAHVAQSLVPGVVGSEREGRALKSKSQRKGGENAPGDHNQAMMELGATICTPRAPLCLQCPVLEFCRTRGEHVTLPRTKQKTRRIAYLLAMRTQGARTEVLLEQRAREASLMPGMFELPPLPLDAVLKSAPLLRVRHAITSTNFQVEVFADDTGLRATVPANPNDLHWASVKQLEMVPLTGLARKCLTRLGIMGM